MVGRAAEQPVRPFRDAPMALGAALQVGARPRQQEPAGEVLVTRGERHRVLLLSLAFAIVDGGEGARGVAEGRMRGYVGDPLAADIDAAAVAQSRQILFAGAQHVSTPEQDNEAVKLHNFPIYSNNPCHATQPDLAAGTFREKVAKGRGAPSLRTGIDTNA